MFVLSCVRGRAYKNGITQWLMTADGARPAAGTTQEGVNCRLACIPSLSYASILFLSSFELVSVTVLLFAW